MGQPVNSANAVGGEIESAHLAPLQGQALKSPGPVELIVAAALIAVVLLAQLAVSRFSIEYKDGYWLDEYDTAMVAGDPDPARAAKTMLQDGTPPVYYWILRPLVRWAGANPILVARACSTVAMGFALFAIYAALRSGFAPGVAGVALLVTWAHPLVARYIVEARSYAMLLAGVAGLAWAMRWKGRKGIVGRVVFSAWACSMQYLGVLAIGVMLVGELLAGPGKLRDRFKRIIPACAGCLVLPMLLPWFLKQRQLFGATWIAPFSASSAGKLLIAVFFPLGLISVMFFCCLSQFGPSDSREIPRQQIKAIAPLLAMLVLPIVFIVAALLGQSFLVDRYMIATVIGMSAVAAPLVAWTAPKFRFVLGVVLVALATLLMQWNAGRLASNQRLYANIAREARQDSYPIFFTSRYDAYPMWFRFPDLRSRMATIDLRSRSQNLPRGLAFDQRAQAMREGIYDLPPMISLQAARTRGIFRYVGTPEGINALPGVEVVDPQQELCGFKQ